MGSCGSYSASLSINYSIKTTTPNTVEQCSEYLKSRKSPLYLTSTEQPTKKLIQSLLDSNMNFLLDYDNGSEIWEPNDDPIEGLEEYSNSDNYCVHIEITPEQLIKCDLSLIPNDRYRDIINSDFTMDDSLLDISESIYWENDNSSYDSIDITPALLKKLARPNAKLVLSGDGNGY